MFVVTSVRPQKSSGAHGAVFLFRPLALRRVFVNGTPHPCAPALHAMHCSGLWLLLWNLATWNTIRRLTGLTTVD